MSISPLIAGRYRVIKLLGEGKYGKVYKVKDRTDKKILALKLCPERHSLRLKREFSLLSRFNHPNIVRVFDFGSIPKYSFFTMEFVNGLPINQTFKGYSKELIEILFQICEALEAIHSQGLLHSDLKPQNVLVKRDFSVKLLDLGFANDYSTISHIPRGSLGYIAPEVFKATGADARSDLYSLGVIAYEVLTHRKPFEEEGITSQLRSQYYSQLPPPISLNPEIPEKLDSLVFSLTRKEPDKRSCSAMEVMERLKDSFSLTFSLPSLKKPKRFLLSSPLIGRKDVLKRLKENWEKGGNVTFVTGDIGVGKSRVLKEFKFLTQIEDSLALLYSPRESGRDLLTWFINQIPDFKPPEADELPETDVKEKRYQLFEILTQKLLNFWKDNYKSLVLLLDDLDLFNPVSLDLLRYISLSIDKEPVMVIASGLSSQEIINFIQEFSEKPWFSHLKILPLNPEQTKRLISSLLGKAERIEELSKWLYKVSGGNPLFILQTIHSLIDQEFLTYLKGKWIISQDLKDFHLPEEIRGIAETRLKGLSPEEKEVLKTASVIGRGFEISLITSLYPDSFDILESLTFKGFLNITPKSEYVISNKILSEVIEERIEPEKKRELHKRVAQAVESLYPDQENFIYDLAHYYTQAGIKEKAYYYSIKAAELAKKSYLTRTSLEYYKNALSQEIATPDETIEILKEIGDLESILGRFPQAIESYSQAIQISKEKRYNDKIPPLLCRLGATYQLTGDYNRAMREFKRAKELLPEKPSKIEAEILGRMGWYYLAQGSYDKAGKLFFRTLRMSKGMRDSRMRANALYDLGSVFWYKRDIPSALEYAEKSLNLYKRLSDPYHTAITHRFLGNIFWEKGDMEKSKEYHKRALSFQRKARAFYSLTRTLNNLGLISQNQSELDEARRYFEESLLLAERIGDKETTINTSINLGTILQDEGDWKRAYQYFSKSLGLSKGIGYKRGMAISLDNLGSLFTLQGDIAQAKESLEQALKIEEELKDETLLFFLYYHLVQFHLQERRYNLAKGYLSKAIRYARRLNNPQWLSQSLFLLAQLRLYSKDFKKALAYAERSISLVPPFSKEYGIGLRILGLAQSYSGKRREGVENLKKSMEIFRKAGMRYELGISLYESVRAEIEYIKATKDTSKDLSPIFSDLREAEEIFNYLNAKSFIKRIGDLKSRMLETWISTRPFLRREYLKVFQKLGRMMNTELEKPDFLEKILDFIIENTNAERGLIFLLEGKKLHLAIGRNIDHTTLKDARRISRSVIESVKKSAKPLISFDALSDPRFSNSQSVMLHKIRSLLCVPLRISDSILGTVYLDSRVTTHLFKEEDKDFLTTVADLLAFGINKSLTFRRIRDEVHLLRSMTTTDDKTGYCIGKSMAIQKIYRLIEEIAPSNSTVLLTGETGSGKGVMAQLIHSKSQRKDGRFITVNCGTLPETLFESELFGHCKGAFTGAVRDKKGLFEEAEGGTIFFDEIANTSLSVQAKLLQVIEEKVIRRVGETNPRKADVRVICATNYDLEEEVKQKRFREDLFYRLNVVSIRVPPLRERPTDIPLFVDYFIEKYAREMKKDIKEVSPKVMDIFLKYRWPGNIRELQNTLEKAMLIAKGDKITLEDIDPRIRGKGGDFSFKEQRKEYEKERIKEVLELNKGNISKSAEYLGISRIHLHRLLRKYHIDYKGLTPQ